MDSASSNPGQTEGLCVCEVCMFSCMFRLIRECEWCVLRNKERRIMSGRHSLGNDPRDSTENLQSASVWLLCPDSCPRSITARQNY